MNTLLIVLLVLLLLGAFGTAPIWPHSAHLGYGPSGGLFLVVIVLIVLALTGRL